MGKLKEKAINGAANLLFHIRPAFAASFLKRIIRLPRLDIETKEGIFSVDRVSYFGRELMERGTYEPEIIESLRRFLEPGSVFVDAGANEGYFSVIGSRLVRGSGKVIAIEPQDRLRKIVEKNLELNSCHNVELVPVAVSDKEEEAVLYLSPDTNTGSTALARTTKYPLSKQKTRTMTLSGVFRACGVETCDFLKMDVEGWEFEAIMGSQNLFRSKAIKAFWVEFHKAALLKRGKSVEEIIFFLLECGYRSDSSLADGLFIS